MAMSVRVEGRKLMIELDLEETPYISRGGQGKKLVVASSHGNRKTDVVIRGHNLVLGVNAYIKAM